jgi:hypothetical protein
MHVYSPDRPAKKDEMLVQAIVKVKIKDNIICTVQIIFSDGYVVREQNREQRCQNAAEKIMSALLIYR